MNATCFNQRKELSTGNSLLCVVWLVYILLFSHLSFAQDDPIPEIKSETKTDVPTDIKTNAPTDVKTDVKSDVFQSLGGPTQDLDPELSIENPTEKTAEPTSGDQTKVINTTGIAEDLLQKKTEIEKPMMLRDPFKSPGLRKKSEVEELAKQTTFRNGVFTNIPSLDLLNLDNIKVIGTLMGEGPRVMVVSKDNLKSTVLMKEGDKIGSGKVELKAILPKGIIFVEQITNVYGQLEYLETVVPISD
jgi:type IV pilus assembly protein PilP